MCTGMYVSWHCIRSTKEILAVNVFLEAGSLKLLPLGQAFEILSTQKDFRPAALDVILKLLKSHDQLMMLGFTCPPQSRHICFTVLYLTVDVTSVPCTGRQLEESMSRVSSSPDCILGLCCHCMASPERHFGLPHQALLSPNVNLSVHSETEGWCFKSPNSIDNLSEQGDV